MVDFDWCGGEGDRTSDDDFNSSFDLPAKCPKLSLGKGKGKKSASDNSAKVIPSKNLTACRRGIHRWILKRTHCGLSVTSALGRESSPCKSWQPCSVAHWPLRMEVTNLGIWKQFFFSVACKSANRSWKTVFCITACGKNKLAASYGEKCMWTCGKTERHINHSLRTTGATSLFRKNVLKKVIQEVMGHWILNGLHQYENICSNEKHAALNILTDITNGCSYDQEVQR